MAESHGGLDAIANIPVDDLQEKLRRTMVLGLPVEDEEKPTFIFERQVSWVRHDHEGSPWNWAAAPLSLTTKGAVQPICAYEFFSPLGRQGGFPTEVGDFNPTTVVFTMFEDEYNEVIDSSYATVGPSGHRWYFRFWRPSYGLGGMTVYSVHMVAEGLP